jgi:hypothetical protein
MFEFDTNFNINTGDLNLSYVGSGVHLYKDVTFSFSLLDPLGTIIENDAQLISNPLIDKVIFDILDTGSNLIYQNYKSGTTSRSLTITEAENISIFGKYEPNFGVEVTVTNKIGSSPFKSKFYAYGNELSIDEFKVYDGSGVSNYSKNIFWVFDFAPVEINNFYAKTQNNSDIIIGWNEDFQSYNSEEKISEVLNTGSIYSVLDQIIVENTYKNNLRYVNIDSYDIYASTEDNIILPASDIINKQQNQFYKLSIKKEFFNNLYEFNIKPIGFEYDVPYYFKAVPFSSVGSGKAISFGPNVFKSFTSTGEEIQTSNQFQLAHGESSMKLDFLTGEITTTGLSTIDIVERGVYNTILYTTQITDSNNTVYSSELKIVDTNNSLIGSGISFSEYAISNNSRVVYSATADQSYIYLHVQNVFPTGIYKLYKTLI